MSNEATKTQWPEWAMSEDGEHVWVRADLLDRAGEIARPALDCLDANTVLLNDGIEEMWLDLRDEYDHGWMIRGMARAPDGVVGQDYACFETVMRDYLADGQHPLPNGTYERPVETRESGSEA